MINNLKRKFNLVNIDFLEIPREKISNLSEEDLELNDLILSYDITGIVINSIKEFNTLSDSIDLNNFTTPLKLKKNTLFLSRVSEMEELELELPLNNDFVDFEIISLSNNVKVLTKIMNKKGETLIDFSLIVKSLNVKTGFHKFLYTSLKGFEILSFSTEDLLEENGLVLSIINQKINTNKLQFLVLKDDLKISLLMKDNNITKDLFKEFLRKIIGSSKYKFYEEILNSKIDEISLIIEKEISLEQIEISDKLIINFNLEEEREIDFFKIIEIQAIFKSFFIDSYFVVNKELLLNINSFNEVSLTKV